MKAWGRRVVKVCLGLNVCSPKSRNLHCFTHKLSQSAAYTANPTPQTPTPTPNLLLLPQATHQTTTRINRMLMNGNRSTLLRGRSRGRRDERGKGRKCTVMIVVMIMIAMGRTAMTMIVAVSIRRRTSMFGGWFRFSKAWGNEDCLVMFS